ncbi:MAG TPA: YXWGXW repeat-containing protein [Bryobacteraceae bacterium]|jgi:hypothetical protein|nr:YXWGXW repeat-containing protein [Bryobacteraceae bacterium]
MTKKVLTLTLFALGSVFAQISIGVRIGPPPPPRVVRIVPASPGPDYFWVDGYWYVVGNRYRWHDGYWSRPPYSAAHWVAPHHDGERYFEGFWDGEHGRREHDHHWDRDRDRDFNHDHDRR